MNLAADESVDRTIVERLRLDGHQVAYVAELDPGIKDDQVLGQANSQGAMLLTTDKDFGELVFRLGRMHAGVVLIRLAGLSADTKAEIVSNALKDHGERMAGTISVIAPVTIRIRPRVGIDDPPIT
jgi:predicted nuclease of predicted toxin-antitoxin system